MTFYNLVQACHARMYGPWIGHNKIDLLAMGFAYSYDLTVFATRDGPHLKMVGVQRNGEKEAKYLTDDWSLTLNNVKQAWDSPTKTAGENYLVKDVESCFNGM